MIARSVPAVLQGMNKVASAVQLRFDIRSSPSLEPAIKERLIQLGGSRVTEEGILIIEARRYRTQEQNRADAILRLIHLVQNALQPPKPRHPTRPSVAARAARVDEKKKHSSIKRSRQEKAKEWD